MTDRRQLVLDRLFAILQGIDGVQFVGRNRKELPQEKRPAILLFDAHEVRVDASERAMPRGRLVASPSIVRMAPEIWLVLDQKKPHNEGVGSLLNSLRLEVLKAVLRDDTLQSILGDNGEIRYEGCETDLSRQDAMNGEMGLAIGFIYPLIPSEL